MTPRANQPELFAAAPLTVLGIDPGSRKTGWGVVSRQGRELQRVASGVLWPKADARLDYRLAAIRDGVLRLLQVHEPDLVAIETPFVPRLPAKKALDPKEATRINGQVGASLALASARGCILCAVGKWEHCGRDPLPLMDISPTTRAAVAAGNGRAKKEEVAEGVRKVLGLGLAAMKPDESDALGIAIAGALKWRTR